MFSVLNTSHDSPGLSHLPQSSEETMFWAFPGVHGTRWTCFLWASFLWSVTSAVTCPSAFQPPKFDNISHLPSSLHSFSCSQSLFIFKKFLYSYVNKVLSEEEVKPYAQSAMFNWKLLQISFILFIYFAYTFPWGYYWQC